VFVAHPDLLRVLPTEGRALDLACGSGGQSLWMAQLGVRVVAVDVSGEAIELVRRAATAHGHDVAIEARVIDTDDGLADDLVDLALIVCQRYRAPSLYGELVDRLTVGGVLALTVLSAVGLPDTPGPFHAPPGELHEAFTRDDVEVLVDDEGDGQASVVVIRTA
jgi:SAM-dependent methyltransferase